jgi:hypothetical protein
MSAASASIFAVEVADQAQQDIQALTRFRAQVELGQKRAPAGAEQLRVAVLNALARDQRMHAVLQGGSHLGEHEPLAQQVAQVAQVAWGDVGLGQQIGAQQLRERARVDRVGLDPRGRDRLRAQRVRQMQLAALMLEQLCQPLPAIRRLQRELGLLTELAQQLAEALAVVDQPTRQQLVAVLVDDRDV